MIRAGLEDIKLVHIKKNAQHANSYVDEKLFMSLQNLVSTNTCYVSLMVKQNGSFQLVPTCFQFSLSYHEASHVPSVYYSGNGIQVLLFPVVFSTYSKNCVKRPLSKRPKIGFKTNYRLMQVKSIAECNTFDLH